jgi:CRP/FNR family cyclic AMP-dependent transcriptional regulator
LTDGEPISDGLVAGLSEREAEMLYAKVRRHLFCKGEHIFRQSERHTGIYIIENGIVRSYYVAPNGREITLAYWSPGNFVGGPELFGGGEHLWSGIAHTDASILAISGTDLRALVTRIPALAVNLLDGLVGKARCYSMVLQMLGTRSVIERLASLLLALSSESVDPAGRPIRKIERRLSHAEIGTIVGSSRQWVSSAIDRFRRSGVISVSRDQCIVISDERELRRIAQL